jgi:hypothetical protein
MSQQARVDSFPMLRRLRASLTTFASIASVALDEANTDLQRTLMWVREAQRRYWKTQVQVRTEQFTRAKLALKQREVLDRALSGTRSSCVEEKKALKIAEARLREAEQKLRLVAVWTRQLETEALDYRSGVQGLLNAIEAEIPKACAHLDRMVDSLEAYVALAPPEMPLAPGEMEESYTAPLRDIPSVTRHVEPASVSLKERAKLLRKGTPSAQVRDEVAIGAGWSDSIAIDLFGKASPDGIPSVDAERLLIQRADKVVLVRPKGKPKRVYIERSSPSDGDSGWYVGVADDQESVELVATQAANLLETCPWLTDILSLPVGYLVLLSSQAGPQAVLDQDDNVIWHGVDFGESS